MGAAGRAARGSRRAPSRATQVFLVNAVIRSPARAVGASERELRTGPGRDDAALWEANEAMDRSLGAQPNRRTHE
jgi:hypothetical protein